MDDKDKVRRAEQAKAILDSPVWIEAWEVYRTRILALIEGADSAAVEQVMQAKRLLSAGNAARAHLSAIITDGKVAAADIKLADERKKLWRRNA